MDLMTIGISVAASGAASYFLGPANARRAERAKERLRASTELHGVISTYRQELAFQRNRLYVDQAFPVEYASIDGQERFATDVLRLLPHLGALRRLRLRQALQQLTGTWTFSFAEQRVYVSPDAIDYEHDQARLKIAFRKVTMSKAHELPASFEEVFGLLGMLLRLQNSPIEHQETYDRAETLLVRMEQICSPDRGGHRIEKLIGWLPKRVRDMLLLAPQPSGYDHKRVAQRSRS